MADKMDSETRKRVTVAGGRARAATGDPAELAAARAAGGRRANSPASLAARNVRAWPGLSRAERAEVREILAPLQPRSRPTDVGRSGRVPNPLHNERAPRSVPLSL